MNIEHKQLEIIEFLNQDKKLIDKKINEKVNIYSQYIFRSIGESLNLIKENDLLNKAIYILSNHNLDTLYINNDLSDVVNHILSDNDVVNYPSLFMHVQQTLKNENLYGKLLSSKKRGGYSKLHKYCYHGELDKLKEIVEKRVSPQNLESCNSLDYAALLHISARNGQVDTVKYLLGFCTDVNETTEFKDTPLYIACAFGHKEVANLLLQNGAKVDKAVKGEPTPLYRACARGHKKVVELLLQNGAEVNKATNREATALHITCQNGHREIVELLLEKHADVNKKASDGYTPLHLACMNGRREIAELLLKNGADVKKATNRGATALHVACQNGDREIIKLLLENGTDVNKATTSGATPLYIACMNGHRKSAELLLKKGADVNKANSEGIFPLDCIQDLSRHNPSSDMLHQLEIKLKEYGAIDYKLKIEQKKMESTSWDPQTKFGKIIGDLRKTFDSKDEYILSPEAKGKVEIHGEIPIEGEYMHIARDPVQSEFQYIFEMILAFEQLEKYIKTISMGNNGTDFSTNPGAQLAHSVSGMVVHIKSINNLKDIFSIGPELLLLAYNDAKEKDELKSFFHNAFDKSILCLNARITKLNEYMEKAQNLIDPYAEDFEVRKKENLEEQLYEYSRVFKNLQIREISQKLKRDYQKVKEKVESKPKSRKHQLFQKLFTKERFEEYLTKNFSIKIDLYPEQYDLFTSQFFDHKT